MQAYQLDWLSLKKKSNPYPPSEYPVWLLLSEAVSTYVSKLICFPNSVLDIFVC